VETAGGLPPIALAGMHVPTWPAFTVYFAILSK
jgi:hypothetical protein